VTRRDLLRKTAESAALVTASGALALAGAEAPVPPEYGSYRVIGADFGTSGGDYTVKSTWEKNEAGEWTLVECSRVGACRPQEWRSDAG
jgi:hypothetical protein